MQKEGRLRLQLFQGVGDVSGVYYEASGGQADCRAGVAGWGGYVGACGGRDSEGGEVRGHVWIFDPVGFVGDFLEVEGEAGCGLGWFVSCRFKVIEALESFLDLSPTFPWIQRPAGTMAFAGEVVENEFIGHGSGLLLMWCCFGGDIDFFEAQPELNLRMNWKCMAVECQPSRRSVAYLYFGSACLVMKTR